MKNFELILSEFANLDNIKCFEIWGENNRKLNKFGDGVFVVFANLDSTKCLQNVLKLGEKTIANE